ncbi:glycosyltransferase [Algoriphagus sp. SE2]|uniref:glycosyltransferase family 2 protein n=1 Tax=Algoriphagus sp. SE2 TaxID=3141536 RepID=UPI0031CCF7A0
MEKKVSVIIPVFEAEEYIEEAVKSTLGFSEIGEVILVEDGSKDNSFLKCKKLESDFEFIKLVSHTNRENKGASASRNLGIKLANFPFIAFLDADDYFQPNRFKSFRDFFEKSIDFDGIYEPVQYFNGSQKIYRIKKNIPPEKLLHYLIRGTYGHFHTNGLLVKKDLLIKAGLFNESLRLHQDSELWLKLAFYGRLVSGNINTPVAMVRVHSGNRIWSGTSNVSRFLQWRVTWAWAWNKPIGLLNKFLILRKLLKYKIGSLSE